LETGRAMLPIVSIGITVLIYGKISTYHPYTMQNFPPIEILHHGTWKIPSEFSI